MRLELEQSSPQLPPQETEGLNELQSPFGSTADIIKRGIAAARSGNRSQARILLKHGVEVEPDSEVAWMWLASISEYPEELLVFLDQVLLINPDNRRAIEWKEATEILLAKTFVQRGIDAANSGRNENAVQFFNEALKYDEQNQIAWFWLASLRDANDTDLGPRPLPETFEFSEPAFPEPESSESDQPAKAYTPPHSESVILHPIPTPASDDGPTQELILPDSLLESNPFETGCDGPADLYPIRPIENFGSMGPEVVMYEEPTIVEEDAIPTLEVFGQEPAPDSKVEDCDIQEVLVAASFEEYDEHPFETPRETANDQPRQWFAPTRDSAASFAVDSEEGFCPFCKTEVGISAIVCGSCDAMVTLSDVDAVLEHLPSDPSRLQRAVRILEDHRDAGNLDPESLVNLAMGYLNLGNMEDALSCLQEASSASPNNVLISSHLNTLAIRIAEIRQRQERAQDLPTGKTILVVDDSPTIRKLISGKLEKGGHEVFCAEDGEQAVDILKSLTPHLVLLDINMPKLDGYQVCKMIRSNEKTKNVPVVMISGKDGFFDKVRGKMAGTTDYITKPFGPETLMKTLGTYLRRSPDDIKIAE